MVLIHKFRLSYFKLKLETKFKKKKINKKNKHKYLKYLIINNKLNLDKHVYNE